MSFHENINAKFYIADFIVALQNLGFVANDRRIYRRFLWDIATAKEEHQVNLDSYYSSAISNAFNNYELKTISDTNNTEK